MENNLIPEFNERVSALEKDNSALLQITDKIDELKSTNSHLKEDIISKEKETSICIEKITLLRKKNEAILQLIQQIAFLEKENESIRMLNETIASLQK